MWVSLCKDIFIDLGVPSQTGPYLQLCRLNGSTSPAYGWTSTKGTSGDKHIES